MSRLKMAAVAAALALAPMSPALAQEAEAPASPAPQISPADEAFQAKGVAFEAENAQLSQELQAIMTNDSLDNTTKIAQTDAILTRYAPSFTAFADVMKAYLVELANRPERTAERDQILAAADAIPAQIAGAPEMLRTQIRQSFESPTAAPDAPK